MKITNILWFRKILFTLMLIMLAGCKTDLYTGLSEQEANEMVTILQDAKLDVSKVTGLKGKVNLTVNEKNLGRAVAVLKKNGYPKDKFESLGDVFQKDGLLSTPLEERARYLHAISQQLSETLSNLDGVLTARVHVVLPTVDEVTKETTSFSSASIFIKHYDEVDLKSFIPKIKLLVNNSIPSLEYDRITVLLFPSAGYQTIGQYQSDIKNIYDPEGVEKTQKVSNFVRYILYSLIVIGVFNIGLIIFNKMSGGENAKFGDLVGLKGKAGKKDGKSDSKGSKKNDGGGSGNESDAFADEQEA